MSLATARLSEIADVAAGGGAPQDADAFTAEGTPFIRAGSLNPLINGASESTLEHLTDEVAREHGLRKFPRDTVVFAKSGMSATKGHVYRLRNEAYVVNHLAAIIPNQRVVPEFLEHCLRVFSPVRLIQDAAYPSVRLSDVATMQIPLPPLAQQRRIAEVLDKAEALRAKRRSALAEIDILPQAIFFELFGQPAIPERTVGELLESNALLLHKDGNHGSLYPRADDFGDHGVPFLSAKAVTDDGLIDNSQIERLRDDKAAKLRIGWITKNDVLLAHNASVGKVALYDGRFERALIGTSLTAFRANREVLNPDYLVAALRSSRFQRQLEKGMAQTTRNQVPITAQRRLKIPVPSVELQREFARRVSAVKKLKSAQRASMAKLDALFTSLQHRAFRGEL